jgi:hypothetical protein
MNPVVSKIENLNSQSIARDICYGNSVLDMFLRASRIPEISTLALAVSAPEGIELPHRIWEQLEADLEKCPINAYYADGLAVAHLYVLSESRSTFILEKIGELKNRTVTNSSLFNLLHWAYKRLSARVILTADYGIPLVPTSTSSQVDIVSYTSENINAL